MYFQRWNLLIVCTTLILFQLLLYGVMYFGRFSIPFHKENYLISHNRYFGKTERFTPPDSFLTNLAVYDAQWYLTLAQNWYRPPTADELQHPAGQPRVLQYAFFPIYPLLVSTIGTFLFPIELAAFITSIVIQITLFFSLYYTLSSINNFCSAIKTIVLIFTLPFSIFFRSYYTEGIFLLLLTWFCFFAYKKHYFIAGLVLGIVAITRGSGLLLIPIYAYYLGIYWRSGKISLQHLFSAIVVSVLPLFLWMTHVHMQTGNPLLFLTVKQYWLRTEFPFLRIIQTFAAYPVLPFHSFHASKVDSFMIVVTGFLLFKSKNVLHPFLWWVGLCIWITPILTHDTMSFSRYQSVNLPLFLYLAQVIPNKIYPFVVLLFGTLLLVVGVLFLNYYWIG